MSNQPSSAGGPDLGLAQTREESRKRKLKRFFLIWMFSTAVFLGGFAALIAIVSDHPGADSAAGFSGGYACFVVILALGIRQGRAVGSVIAAAAAVACLPLVTSFFFYDHPGGRAAAGFFLFGAVVFGAIAFALRRKNSTPP